VDNTPGPDGFTGLLYPIIKEDTMCLTHLGGSMVKACISPNQAYMVLLKEANSVFGLPYELIWHQVSPAGTEWVHPALFCGAT